MEKIKKAFSHINYRKKKDSLQNDWEELTRNKDIISAEPLKVSSYLELVDAVAQISFYNDDLFLFSRGQPREYKENGKATIYPSIYREDELDRDLSHHFESLKNYENQLIEHINNNVKATAGTYNLSNYRELRWAIIQHYNRHPTPAIDITHSLHVACSFALKDKNVDESGILYLLGFGEYPKTISYSTKEKVSLVKLLGFSLPIARRPYLQQAYSASPFPTTELEGNKEKFDFARKLVAKFKIENKKDFWGDDFKAIPSDLLTPNEDLMNEKLPPPPVDIDRFWYEVSKGN